MNSTASTSSITTPTLADIDRARKLIESIPPEPLAEYMRDEGYPPALWIMVLPRSMVNPGAISAVLPDYVRVSDLVTAPVFVRRQVL